MTEKKASAEHRKQRKHFLITIGILVLIVLLFPIPGRLKDGGSKTVTALSGIYRVTCWNGMGKAEDEHTDGVTVTVFGLDVIDTYHIVKNH